MRTAIIIGLGLLGGVLVAIGCGSSKNGGTANATGAQGGGAGTTGQSGAGGVSANCKEFTAVCQVNADCCSGVCDPATRTCASSINQCTPAGGPCVAPTECCSVTCAGGVCGSACVADNQACTDSAGCCSGNCATGVCQPLNPACRTAGNPCTANTECCSRYCSNGTCQLGASWCIQTGDACAQAETCCTGDCVVAAGAAVGTCAALNTGATYCQDGVDGTVCEGCNSCCSRLCTPYGPSGVKVCQPASGCHVNGDLCRQDTDCCGAAGTGLPGEGNVICVKEAGKVVGACRNPTGCNPQSNVCHYQDYACSISSARNDCCGATGNSGVCQLDTLGVPRCNGLTTCVPAGGICSSAMDCCDGVPCVPDGTGVLRCMIPPDSGSVCVPRGGACTVDADCCVGTICIKEVGATQGICGNVTPPPDAGVPCAEYGQLCTTAADCCNSVPCYNGICQWAVPQ